MMTRSLPPCLLAISGVLSILLTHLSVSAQDRDRRGNLTPDQWLRQMDADKDGQIAESEAQGAMKRFFQLNDRNEDGVLSRAELEALAERLARRSNPSQNGGPSNEQLVARAPEGVVIHPDLSYREGDSDRWKLDLIVPKAESDTPRPAIVFVHGGGWRSGDKRKSTFLNGAIEYAQKGYVTATVNYRLTDEAPFPACIEDVKCAVRWIRENAEKYNINPDKIGGYGNSAGAHLVSMLGLAGPEANLEGEGPWQDQSSLIQAVCASATPTDFALFGRNPDEDPKWAESGYDPAELSRLSSPITHVKADAPPFLLIHGTADTTVSIQHGDNFVEALEKAGAKDVTYLRIEGSGHGVYTQHRDETHPAMEAFFARTLGTP